MGAEIGGGVKAEPNVVPFCDVLLVLLIIFMIITPMVASGVVVRLPEAINTSNQPEPSNMVYVGVALDEATQKPRYYISNRGKIEEVKILDDLGPKLAEALENLSDKVVYIKADREITFDVISDVLVKIRSEGVEVLGILTEKATE